jgi:hypothetical protein
MTHSYYQSPIDRPWANRLQFDAYHARWTVAAREWAAIVAVFLIVLLFSCPGPR